MLPSDWKFILTFQFEIWKKMFYYEGTGNAAVSDKLELAKKLAMKIQMKQKDETQQAAENFLNKG